MEIGQKYFILAIHLTRNFCNVLQEVPSKNRKRRNIEKGKILCNRKPANYPNYICFLELIIAKQNKHTHSKTYCSITRKENNLKYRIEKASRNYIRLNHFL